MTTACEVICAQNKVRYKSQAQSCRVASCTSVRIIPLHGLCASVPSGLNREAPLNCAGPEGVLTQLRNAVLCVLEVARPSAVPPPSAKAAHKYSCAGRLGRAHVHVEQNRYLEEHFESNIIAVAVPSQLDSAEALLRAVPAALPVVPEFLSVPPQPAPTQPEISVMAQAPTSPEDLAGPVGAIGAEGQTKDVVATAPKQARHRPTAN